MRTKILFCMEDLCFGGTQRQSLGLCLRLDRSRYDITVLTLTGPTDLDSCLEQANIPLVHLGQSRRVPPFFFLSLFFYLRKNPPDLVIPCTALPNIWCRIHCALLGISLLGTCRGGGGPKRQHERLLWHLTKHMICNSQALFSVLHELGVPEEHLTYIPNGVDTDLFRPETPPPSERSPILLCVARLCADKDQLTLMRAFALVQAKEPSAELWLVGDGPDADKLKEWAKKNAHLKIRFIPGTQDVSPYYAKARIFVLPSVREGQPNVLLEAMSSALPICATNVGGVGALLEEGKFGLLIPPSDVHALAYALQKLLAHPNLGDAMGIQAREHVMQKYSYAQMCAAHSALFERFAARRTDV